MEKHYKAYIASPDESKVFDYAFGKSKKNAIAAVKRLNSPSWKDCVIWCVYLRGKGEEEKI